jgi:hypothetical protein
LDNFGAIFAYDFNRKSVDVGLSISNTSKGLKHRFYRIKGGLNESKNYRGFSFLLFSGKHL